MNTHPHSSYRSPRRPLFPAVSGCAVALCCAALTPIVGEAQTTSVQAERAPRQQVARNVTVAPSAQATARGASADPQPERERAIEWKDDWRHVSYPALVSTALLGGGVFAARSLMEPPSTTRFVNSNRMDGAGRQLRLDDPEAGHRVDLVSDFTRYSVMLWPVVDALMVAAVDRNPQVGAQMMLMTGQSMALTGFATRLVKTAAGRPRPYQQDCNPDLEDCAETGASFFSGHTATAFTGAGLVCVQHRHLDLYGGGWGDKAACGMALTAASATGIFRILADKHWTSDVLVGASVGLLSGWLLPRLLYFRSGEGEDFVHRRMRRGVVSPFGDQQSLGLQYQRIF